MSQNYRGGGGYYQGYSDYPQYDSYAPYYEQRGGGGGYAQPRRGAQQGYRRNYYDNRGGGGGGGGGQQRRSYNQYPAQQSEQRSYYTNRYANRNQSYSRQQSNQYYNNRSQSSYNRSNQSYTRYSRPLNPNDPNAPNKAKDDGFDYDDANWMDNVTTPTEDARIKTADVTKTKGSSFSDFSLNKRLLRGILEIGFLKPSPVQEESIPNILMGNNVLCRAKNGTGKTGAYCIPLLQLVDTSINHIQGLVLVPTRELALQTSRFIRQISKHLQALTVVCSTGGTSLKEDIVRFKQRSVHLVVATPGRLLDLASHGHARLGKCGLVVMDEADKLLSEDFVGLIDKILMYVPRKNRQLLLYSATFPTGIKAFVDKNMGKEKKEGGDDEEEEEEEQRTVFLNLMDDLTLHGITQFYAYVREPQKVHCLFTLIKKLMVNQCIIFCKSMNRVELLARKITKLGFSCFYIHSKMSQNDRNRVFHQFTSGDVKESKEKGKDKKNRCRFLICTDLITRGIDVKQVNVVINFDFPKAAETYLHRIGRAGRFGHLAIAVNFVTDTDRESLYQIEADLETEIQPIPADVDKIDKALYCQ